MASIWQFVADMSGPSPTVNLDLNDHAGKRVLLGWKLGPTLFEKGYDSSPLRHGKRPTRSTGANQILEIPVEINKSSEALGAQAVEDLVRQLAVNNILKVQLDGAPAPVFFRTFGDADFAAAVRTVLIRDASVVLSIEAEPFAYGPRIEVTGSPFTVSNDPAAGTNPMRFDITGVLGDVETPLFLIATSTGATNGLLSKWTHVGTRRRGTPSNYSNVIQAENMTQGTNATVTADATFSGGSKSRISFGTATNVLRLNDTFPDNGTSVIDAAGEYVVYGRFAKTTAGDTISVQLGYGASSTNPVMNDAVTLPAAAAGPYWVNLGKVPVPAWTFAAQHGFSGVSTKVVLPFVGLYAARTAGSGNLDVDCLYFMPADESTVIVKWPSTDTTYVLDATSAEGGSAYAMTTALDEVITTAGPAQIVGAGFPELIPGATNRIHWLRQVDPAGTVDGITNTTTIKAYYWPRWREPFRP
jgi:hypothetical protein